MAWIKGPDSGSPRLASTAMLAPTIPNAQNDASVSRNNGIDKQHTRQRQPDAEHADPDADVERDVDECEHEGQDQ